MMPECGYTAWQAAKPGTFRPDAILKQIKPALAPHGFRHNCMMLRYESGIDPLVAMKIVGHTDCQTTANTYAHLKEETPRKASVHMEKVFLDRAQEEGGEQGRSGITREVYAVLRHICHPGPAVRHVPWDTLDKARLLFRGVAETQRYRLGARAAFYCYSIWVVAP